MTVIDDTFIIERMRAGDSAAFRLVFDNNYVVLFRFACQLTRDRALAEEIADDTILYLWQNCDRIDISRSIRSYLMQAVKTRCIDELRSNRRRAKYETTEITAEENLAFLSSIFTDAGRPLGILLSNELEDVLNRSINKLPPECSAVFRQSRFEQKHYDRIAADLGISVNTVKYHIKHALAFLRKDLAGYLRWLIVPGLFGDF